MSFLIVNKRNHCFCQLAVVKKINVDMSVLPECIAVVGNKIMFPLILEIKNKEKFSPSGACLSLHRRQGTF